METSINDQVLEFLVHFPHLVHRPFWAVAPLAPRKEPFPRLWLPRESYEPVTPPEPRPAVQCFEDEAPRPQPSGAVASSPAGSGPHPGPRYAFEQGLAFPADTPLELLGAYQGLAEAAGGRGLSVRWARLRPATLEAWLDDGQQMAELAIYYGPGRSPLLARVMEASSQAMADAAFDLLRGLQREPAAAEEADFVHPAAGLSVTYVSPTGEATAYTFGDLCACLGGAQEAGVPEAGIADEAALVQAAYANQVAPGLGYWLVDGAPTAPDPTADSPQLTGLSVLHFCIATDRYYHFDFLEKMKEDPFLADIFLAGFYWGYDNNLTVLVQLWPGAANYVASREILRRYVEDYYYDEGELGEKDPSSCACILAGAPEDLRRPVLLSHSEWQIKEDYGVQPSLQ